MNLFKNNFKKTLSNKEGFTLTEMMIVIAIIAMIGGFVTVKVMGQFDRAKVDSCKIQIKQLGTVLDTFKRDCGFYPNTDQGLDALINKPTSGRECKNYDPNGYLSTKKLPTDPWQNTFLYESDGVKYTITSLGADAKEGGDGTAKDIRSDEE